MEHSQAERRKNSYQEINFAKNIEELEALFWNFEVLALVSKNTATWRSH